MIWIPVLLGVVGVGALTLSRKGTSTVIAAEPIGKLVKGQLYRIWVQVDPSYTTSFRTTHKGETQQAAFTEDLKQKIEHAGFYPILLASQDPSKPEVWTFLARWAISSVKPETKPPIHIFRLQAVADIPEGLRPPEDPPVQLDQGLLVDEIEAIRYALAHDEDPKHLSGFSYVLSPEFPIASSLLNAKAVLAEASSRKAIVAGDLYERTEAIRHRYEAASQAVRFGSVFDWVGDQAETAVDRLKSLTSDLGDTVQSMWNNYGGIVEVLGGWVPGPQIWMVETAYKVAKDIQEGKPIGGVIPERLSEQGARFAKGMQKTSPFVAMIPGLGTGVAMAMNASAALALAQPLEEAAIETIALLIPGSAAVQNGFLVAANFGNGMLKGETWDEAAVEAARAFIKKNVGEEGAIAFDAGLAIARGKSLQSVGFQALYQLTKGNELADRAARFAEAVIIAKQQGRSVKSVLIDQIAQSLDEYGRAEAMNQVNKAIGTIQKPGYGWMLQRTPAELAKSLGIEEAYAQAAQAAVREIAEGIRVVDPEVIRRLTPPSAVSELATRVNRIAYADPVVQATTVNRLAYAQPTSPTALKLVESTRRPETSLVVDPKAAASRVTKVIDAANAGDPEAKRAKEALDKATRELERRKWVEWYRRQREADMVSSPAGQQVFRGQG